MQANGGIDWLFDRVAAIRAKTRRRDVGGG